MHVLVTSAHGFIDKNLVVCLGEQAGTKVLSFIRGDSAEVFIA